MKVFLKKINWLHILEIALFIGVLIFIIFMWIRVNQNAAISYAIERETEGVLEPIYRLYIRRLSKFLAILILFSGLLVIDFMCLLKNCNGERYIIDKVMISMVASVIGIILLVWMSGNGNASATRSDPLFDDSFKDLLSYAFRSAVGLPVN